MFFDLMGQMQISGVAVEFFSFLIVFLLSHFRKLLFKYFAAALAISLHAAAPRTFLRTHGCNVG